MFEPTLKCFNQVTVLAYSKRQQDWVCCHRMHIFALVCSSTVQPQKDRIAAQRMEQQHQETY